MKMLTRWMCALLLAGCAAEAPEGSFVQDETGIVVTPASDASRQVRLQVRTDRIVRVTSADAKAESPKSLMVVDATSKAPAFKVEKREGEVVLVTEGATAGEVVALGSIDTVLVRGPIDGKGSSRPRRSITSYGPRARSTTSARFGAGSIPRFHIGRTRVSAGIASIATSAKLHRR
jgi:hypothetical protein